MDETQSPPALAAPGDRGRLTIADQVLDKIASVAAREVQDVTDSQGGLTDLYRSLPRASAKVAGGRARVGVEVAATWPASLSTVGAAVRDRVSEQVTLLTGVTVVAVDVTIADVVRPGQAGRKAPRRPR